MTSAARRLEAALGFLQLPPEAPELCLLRAWADTWNGVGAIVTGLLARLRRPLLPLPQARQADHSP